jgi:hypothetical protein
MTKYKHTDEARKQKYEEAMRAKHEYEKTHGPIRRPSGKPDLAFILARSVVLIFVDAWGDWLDGDVVHLGDIRTLIEQLLRDELFLVNEFRHPDWFDEDPEEGC